jgi:hypothetical protein
MASVLPAAAIGTAAGSCGIGDFLVDRDRRGEIAADAMIAAWRAAK